MAFGEFMKAQKKKEKLEYDPNDGVIVNEPKGHKEKEDLATKVAEMNKAAEERHKADQDDELDARVHLVYMHIVPIPLIYIY